MSFSDSDYEPEEKVEILQVETPEECRRKILSNDYADFIFEYFGRAEDDFLKYEGYCPMDLGAQFGAIFAARDRIPPLSIEEYLYMSIPKIYGLMDMSAMEDSGILRLQNQPNLQLKGQGVMIGFIDTGIDLLNPVFLSEAGKSRIVSLWDQNGEEGPLPEGFLYGREYREEEIQEIVDRYRQSGLGKRQFERENDIPTDQIGHGTFMAALAAGSEQPEDDFIGAAPLADIVVVKLKEAKQYLKNFFFVREGAVAYQENDIMMGMQYLKSVSARYRRPMVMVLGLGTNQGDHAGSSPLGKSVSDMASTLGICVVTAGGNEGDKRHHYTGFTPDNQTPDIVEINVGENENGFTVELWGEPPDIYSISIIAPSGEQSGRILPGIVKSEVVRFIFERTVIYIDYKIVETRTGKQLIIARFREPTPGIWKIVVYNSNTTIGEYNMWLPISEFIEEGTFFLKSNPDITLVEPSNAFSPITVSGYDNKTGAIYASGSRGFTRSGIIKPDFAAPAVNVYAPNTAGGYSRVTGTSVGAAITAGVAAQFFTWGYTQGNQRTMKTVDVKNYLIRGIRRDPQMQYPNRQSGYGKLDGYHAFEVLI